jgi:hypothetical protein
MEIQPFGAKQPWIRLCGLHYLALLEGNVEASTHLVAEDAEQKSEGEAAREPLDPDAPF